MKSVLSRACVVAIAAWQVGCHQRADLPPPSTPFTLTPDAPFRSREIPLAEISTDVPRILPERLDNGLTIVCVERPAYPLVAVSYVDRRAGTIASSCAGKTARLTAEALVHAGTIFRGGVVSDLRVDGAETIVRTAPDSSRFDILVGADAYRQALEVLAATVRAPASSPESLEAVRARVLLEDQRRFDGRMLAWEDGYASIYGRARADDLLATFHGDLVADVGAVVRCHLDAYRPDASAAIVVGDVAHDACVDAVRREFGSWSASLPADEARTALLEPQAPPSGVHIHLVVAGGPTSHVVIAEPAPALAAPDLAPLELAGRILAGSFDSRLMHSLRHESAVTYGVRIERKSFRDSGVLFVEGGFKMTRTADAVRELLSQLAALRRARPSDAELALAKLRSRVELREQLRAGPGLAQWIGDMFVANDFDLLSRFDAALSSVTAEDVLSASRRYLRSSSLDVVVFSNPYTTLDDLRDLGSVELFNVTSPEIWDVERRFEGY